VRARAHVPQQVEVGALEGAVLVDVGDDVAGAARGLQALQGLVQVAALTGPAARGQGGAAHVQADGDPVAVLGDDPGAPVGVLQCGGADVDAAASRGQRRVQRLVVADSPGQFHLDVEPADDGGQQFPVVAPAEGGVQV